MPALEGREHAQGPEDRCNMNNFDHLETVYLLRGRLDKAEASYTCALSNLEELGGPEDMILLHTVHNVGLQYLGQVG